jgi:hypothetical protein
LLTPIRHGRPRDLEKKIDYGNPKAYRVCPLRTMHERRSLGVPFRKRGRARVRDAVSAISFRMVC